MHTVGRASSRPGRPGYIVSGVDMFVRMIPTAIIIFRVGLVSLIILSTVQRERERERVPKLSIGKNLQLVKKRTSKTFTGCSKGCARYGKVTQTTENVKTE